MNAITSFSNKSDYYASFGGRPICCCRFVISISGNQGRGESQDQRGESHDSKCIAEYCKVQQVRGKKFSINVTVFECDTATIMCTYYSLTCRFHLLEEKKIF